MERVVHIAKGHKEADQWDIEQHIRMTPDERMRIARILRERVYGKNTKDVRECMKVI